MSSSTAAFVGHRWRVVAIDDTHGAVSVPRAINAEIGFTRDGRVLGRDTVNALQGEYEITANGYIVRHAGSTLALYVGEDPVRRRVIAAIKAVFRTYVVPGEPAREVHVQATLLDDALKLSRDKVTLTLERTGSQPDWRQAGEATGSNAVSDDS